MDGHIHGCDLCGTEAVWSRCWQLWLCRDCWWGLYEGWMTIEGRDRPATLPPVEAR